MTRNYLLVLLFNCCCVAFGLAADTGEPAISLKQALAKAEKHVVDKKLDVSALLMVSVYRSESPRDLKQNCWTIVWRPRELHILDGELRIYVSDDGRIEHGGSA